MTLKALFVGLGVAALAVGVAACTPQTSTTDVMPEEPMVETEVVEEMAEPTAEMNVVEVAAAAGQFNTLLQLATQAGLADALSTQEVTVFAPTDEAFAALPAETLEAVQADPELLAKVLQYHVVAGVVPAADVVTVTSVDTLAGEPLAITVEGGKVMVNDANVVQADVMASNGVIHVIDTVLVPEM